MTASGDCDDGISQIHPAAIDQDFDGMQEGCADHGSSSSGTGGSFALLPIPLLWRRRCTNH